jgi:hypothetical protein
LAPVEAVVHGKSALPMQNGCFRLRSQVRRAEKLCSCPSIAALHTAAPPATARLTFSPSKLQQPSIPSPRLRCIRPIAPLRLSRPHSRAPLTTMASADLIEYAKASAAKRAVAEHFSPHSSYVGIGSGTTVVHVVSAIKEVSTNPDIRFVPTGSQSRKVITDAGLKPIAFDELPDDVVLDVAFDGADECDEELNCVKGGGACLFQEKIVVERAKKFVCVAGMLWTTP